MQNDATREAVARIVDPAAWMEREPEDYYPAANRRVQTRRAASLAKADAILALLADRAGWRIDAPEYHEGNVRIAVWNVCRARGMSDVATYALINDVVAALESGAR